MLREIIVPDEKYNEILEKIRDDRVYDQTLYFNKNGQEYVWIKINDQTNFFLNKGSRKIYKNYTEQKFNWKNIFPNSAGNIIAVEGYIFSSEETELHFYILDDNYSLSKIDDVGTKHTLGNKPFELNWIDDKILKYTEKKEDKFYFETTIEFVDNKAIVIDSISSDEHIQSLKEEEMFYDKIAEEFDNFIMSSNYQLLAEEYGETCTHCDNTIKHHKILPTIFSMDGDNGDPSNFDDYNYTVCIGDFTLEFKLNYINVIKYKSPEYETPETIKTFTDINDVIGYIKISTEPNSNNLASV